jgi:hypothetical protein
VHCGSSIYRGVCPGEGSRKRTIALAKGGCQSLPRPRDARPGAGQARQIRSGAAVNRRIIVRLDRQHPPIDRSTCGNNLRVALRASCAWHGHAIFLGPLTPPSARGCAASYATPCWWPLATPSKRPRRFISANGLRRLIALFSHADAPPRPNRRSITPNAAGVSSRLATAPWNARCGQKRR